MSGVILTTAPTPADVRYRLLQICAAFAVARPTLLKTVIFDTSAQLVAAGSPASGKVSTECKLTAADLPALVAITSTGVPLVERTATRQSLETRNYLLLVLMAEIASNSLADQITALAVLWAKLSELPDYFSSQPLDRLRFGGDVLKGLRGVGRMTDSGTEDPIIWQGMTYSHAVYTLPVITERN